MQYLGAISKMTEWSLFIQGKPFNITVIQVYAPTSNAEEAEDEQFYEDLQELLELIPKKDVLFIIGDWNAKVESQETVNYHPLDTEVSGKYLVSTQWKQIHDVIMPQSPIPSSTWGRCWITDGVSLPHRVWTESQNSSFPGPAGTYCQLTRDRHLRWNCSPCLHEDNNDKREIYWLPTTVK